MEVTAYQAHPVLLTVYVVANLSIALGYAYVGAFIAPYFTIPDWRGRIGGVLFFALCGWTHVEQAAHAIAFGNAASSHLLRWHMVIPHIIQAFAVWAFILSMRAHLGRLRNNDQDQRIAYAFQLHPWWQSAPDILPDPPVERRVNGQRRRPPEHERRS